MIDTMVVADVGATADAVSGALFGASLFPWLGMLYFLGHPKTDAPKGVTFGLWFLLVFVFGSIPAAIASEKLFGASLADVDWLHGAAESLLAVTNFVVVLGFRDALESSSGAKGRALLAWTAGAFCVATAGIHVATGAVEQHSAWLTLSETGWYPAEPSNALSFATWVIHTSSLVEWLVAMGLCWRFAEVSRVPQYKGLTWGMLPLHTSGIVACTYHLFFNSVSWCVALQAFMTCVGNTTMAAAAYRLAVAGGWNPEDDLYLFKNTEEEELLPSSFVQKEATTTKSLGEDDASLKAAVLPGWEDLGDAWKDDTNFDFLSKVLVLSVGSAAAVKAAPALLPEETLRSLLENKDELNFLTVAVIVIPTMLNVLKWQRRSSTPE